jgi:N-acetyl-anhydromuramyl-L-alanine amidase AmpD
MSDSPQPELGQPRRAWVVLGTLVPLMLATSGCGRIHLRWPFQAERPGWEVQRLAEPELPRLSEPQLARCAARLDLAPERDTPADPSNYGERQAADAFGRPVPARPQLIVLHETVMGEPETLSFFRTPHSNDADQASYHLLINPAGQRLRLVPDEKRAFGAGMSAFGDFTVRIRPQSLGSINNVALHLSLVTPPDGRGDAPAHSGYSPSQYRAAAAQVLLWQARHGIPLSRLTTHAAVDRSHSRYDPRSFRWDRFMAAYRKAAGSCGLTAYDTGRATI